MGWIEINICVQRAMLLKVTKYSSPIRIASTITKQIPQRVDIRYFSYSSLANVSFYLSTASFLTSRSSIIIIQRHFYPDLARVLNARWGRSERKCLRKSVNLNPFKIKTWEKKKISSDGFNDHWISSMRNSSRNSFSKLQILLHVPSRILARVRILSSNLASRRKFRPKSKQVEMIDLEKKKRSKRIRNKKRGKKREWNWRKKEGKKREKWKFDDGRTMISCARVARVRKDVYADKPPHTHTLHAYI